MIKSIFNFVFIWLLFLSSLGFTLYQIQRPDFLTTQVKEVRLYERITGNVGSFIPKEMKAKMPFTDSELKDIVTGTIDAATFYGFLDQAAAAYLEYLTGRQDTIEFTYHLAPLKTTFADALTAKMVAKYAALPICKANQLKSWQADEGLPECQLPPSNVQSNDVNRLFARQAAEVTSEWPDDVAMPGASEELIQARSQVTQAIKVIYIIWAVTLGFLLLYLLIFRSRAFLPLAVIFLLAGALEIGFSLIGWQYVSQVVVDLLNSPGQNLAGFTADMAGALAEVLKTIMGNLSIISLVTGAVFLVIGVIARFHAGVKAVTPGR